MSKKSFLSSITLFVTLHSPGTWAIPEMDINKTGQIMSISDAGQMLKHKIVINLKTGEKERLVGEDYRSEVFADGYVIIDGIKFDNPSMMISTLDAVNFSQDVGADEYKLVVLVGKRMVQRWLTTIEEQSQKNSEFAKNIEQMKGDCNRNTQLFIALAKNNNAVLGNCPLF